LDENLDMLERRAASGMKRAGVMAGIGLAVGVGVGGIAFLVIRRTRRPSLGDRVHDAIPSALIEIPDELKKKLGGKPFKIIITNADVDEGRSVWESTARKLAPTLVTSAVSAVMAQALGRRSGKEDAGSG